LKTLRVLLVLSIINAACYIFSCLVLAASLPQLSAMFESNPALLPNEMHTAWNTLSTIPRPYYVAMALLYALSLAGCILMWNFRRSGFHCYALSQLIVLLLPLLFLGKGFVGLGDIMFTLLFLYVYHHLLKKIENQQQQTTEGGES
jgi:hypothetical protein